MSTVGGAHLDALLLTSMLADGEMAAARTFIEQSSPMMLSLGFSSILATVIPQVADHEGVHPRDVLDRMVDSRLAVELAATDL